MIPPPRRSAGGLLAACLATLLACGCGKSDLVTGGSAASSSPRRPAAAARPPRHAAPALASDLPAATPLALTAARAEAFARAVELTSSDVVGGRGEPRTRTPEQEEREAAECGGRATRVIGGGRSPDFVRGAGLDRESISSSVEVLPSASDARGDLAYSNSRKGILCYARVLRNSLRSGGEESLHIGRLDVGRLQVQAPAGATSAGVRIVARLRASGSRLSVPLYVDALAFGYGPAEIDLYTTSFVQPEPVRTDQQLLTLLWERARRQRL